MKRDEKYLRYMAEQSSFSYEFLKEFSKGVEEKLTSKETETKGEVWNINWNQELKDLVAEGE